MRLSFARRFLTSGLSVAVLVPLLVALPSSAQTPDPHEHEHGHGHEAPPRRSPTPEEVEALARLKREVPPPSEQNLDFEDGDSPAPWILGGRGYTLELDSEHAQSGERSLRIRYEENGRFAVASLPFDAKTVLGKRLRLTGWLKSEDLAQGHGGLWMRVDVGSQMVAFDNMNRRGVSGTTDWTRYVIELDVPEDATRIFYGAVLTGIGTLWVDHLAIEGVEIVPPEKVAVRGTVVDADGKGVAGATVALAADSALRETALRETAVSGDDGAFRFEDVAAGGEYALSAVHGSAFAALESATYGADGEPVVLTLGPGPVRVTGRVFDLAGKPWPGATVEAVTYHPREARVFAVKSGDEGAYSISLPTAENLLVRLVDESTQAVSRASATADGERLEIDLRAIPRGVPRKGMVADFGAGSLVLATTHPTQPVSELEEIGELVGDARVVALGQSSPGTKELFEMKHRLTEFLLGRGFQAVALPWPAEIATRADAFVKGGDDDPREILEALDTWTWKTHEALSLLERLRELRAGGTDVRLIGYADGEAEEQAKRILEPLGDEGKLVLWGDNRSIARNRSAEGPVGAHLADALGESYLAMAGFFAQGAFLAVGSGPEHTDGPTRFWLGPVGKQHLEHLFSQLGGKLSAQDLRRYEPGGEVARHLAVPRPYRDLGETFWGEAAMDRSMILTDAFDAGFFVESTTKARLLE